MAVHNLVKHHLFLCNNLLGSYCNILSDVLRDYDHVIAISADYVSRTYNLSSYRDRIIDLPWAILVGAIRACACCIDREISDSCDFISIPDCSIHNYADKTKAKHLPDHESAEDSTLRALFALDHEYVTRLC